MVSTVLVVTTGAIVNCVLYVAKESFSLNLDFASLIVAEQDILTSAQSDRLKLSSLGEIYYDCSQGILAKSEELLNLATRDLSSQGDIVIDESFELFLQGWLRQSVSVGFLNAYMQPRKRQAYSREESTKIREIAPIEAVAAFAVEDRVTEAVAVADEENVGEWAECLVEVMGLWGHNSYTYNQLVDLSNLSSGKLFLAVFLDERFTLSSIDSDFYNFIVSFSSPTLPFNA